MNYSSYSDHDRKISSSKQILHCESKCCFKMVHVCPHCDKLISCFSILWQVRSVFLSQARKKNHNLDNIVFPLHLQLYLTPAEIMPGATCFWPSNQNSLRGHDQYLHCGNHMRAFQYQQYWYLTQHSNSMLALLVLLYIFNAFSVFTLDAW